MYFTKHPLRRLVGRRIIAATQAITLRGTLAAYSTGWLEIKDAEAVDHIAGTTKADGIILLPENRIDYIQAVNQ